MKPKGPSPCSEASLQTSLMIPTPRLLAMLRVKRQRHDDRDTAAHARGLSDKMTFWHGDSDGHRGVRHASP